jgi:hypothetical protein
MDLLKPAPPKPAPPPNPVPTVTERVQATPENVGVKGKEYGGGIITEPLAQRWRVQDRIVMDQVKKALDLHHALNDGRYPATHDEFMEKVIRANNLKLPDLPPGQRYLYVPETHELMVERTVAAPGAVKQ